MKRTIKLNNTKFILGNEYEDTLLGTRGVAVAGAQYLTGCDQLQLTYTDKSGCVNDVQIDVTRIKDVKVEKKAGGPPSISVRHP